MKVVYQVTVEIDDEEVDRAYLHENHIEAALERYCDWANPGSIRVLHSVKTSERDK